MRVITLKNPWGALVCLGLKDVENRSWSTRYKGEVLIHVSQKPAFVNGYADRLPKGWWQEQNAETIDKILRVVEYSSAIIGSVKIVDCVHNHPSIWAEKSFRGNTANPLPFGEENDGDHIIWNWVLEDAKLFDEPILNVKGNLRFWDYEI